MLKPKLECSSLNNHTSWQEKHVCNNLPQLIRLTNCNVLLLAELRKAGVLSALDEQELEHKCPTPMEKSKKLYDILTTREDFYFILRDALEVTKQTGALRILNDGVLTEVLRDLNVPEELKIDSRLNIDSTDENGNTLLHHAAKAHQVEKLELLSELKANLETKNSNGYTPLLMIVFSKQNFAETLSWFVKQKANLNAEDNDGNNLVLLCVKFEISIEDIVKVVSAGIKWNGKNKQGHTILHLAAQQGNTAALEYFHSLGADINAKDNLGNTPFLQVSLAKPNFTELLSWFVDQNMDVNQVNDAGNNLVHLSIVRDKSENELQQIVELGVDWTTRNCKLETVLHMTVRKGNIKALKYFQSLGACKLIHMKDIDGCPPILKLAKSNKAFIEILSWFVEQRDKFKYFEALGSTSKDSKRFPNILTNMDKLYWFNYMCPDLNAKCKQGNNLAFLSAYYGKTNTELQEIVNCGVNWNTKNQRSQTILHLAAQGGNVEALEYYYTLGADANTRDDQGYTPLLLLSWAKQNLSETLKWFVKKEVDLNAVCIAGNNLAMLAAFDGKSKGELELIVASAVNWDMKNKSGQNVMHLSARGGNIEGLNYFKSLGADVNTRDKYGSTPFLQLTITKKNFLETLTWFCEEQIDLQAVNEYGYNLVLLAALFGRSKDELEHIVGIGVNWKTRNKSGRNVMHLSAEGGNIDALTYFKSLGADVNAVSNNGDTPLLRLVHAKKNFWETLLWFVKEKVDLQAVNKSGNILLLLAVSMERSKDEIEQIVKVGVNWNIKNQKGETALHLAKKAGNTETFRYLKLLAADVGASAANC